jgi:hypothetical protein
MSIIEYNNGTICWYNDKGQCHRVDGPAIEYTDGTKEWYLNSRLVYWQEPKKNFEK